MDIISLLNKIKILYAFCYNIKITNCNKQYNLTGKINYVTNYLNWLQISIKENEQIEFFNSLF